MTEIQGKSILVRVGEGSSYWESSVDLDFKKIRIRITNQTQKPKTDFANEELKGVFFCWMYFNQQILIQNPFFHILGFSGINQKSGFPNPVHC